MPEARRHRVFPPCPAAAPGSLHISPEPFHALLRVDQHALRRLRDGLRVFLVTQEREHSSVSFTRRRKLPPAYRAVHRCFSCIFRLFSRIAPVLRALSLNTGSICQSSEDGNFAETLCRTGPMTYPCLSSRVRACLFRIGGQFCLALLAVIAQGPQDDLPTCMV